MLRWVPASLLWPLIVGTLVEVPQAGGNFGLTSRETNLPLILDEVASARASTPPCDLLALQPGQRRLCRREPALGAILLEAVQLAAFECQYQFQFEKWNCSLGQARVNLLQKAFRETAFLFAISSAGLVHAFARACSTHRLERCTCGRDMRNKTTWLWGGCADNIRFGVRFSRKFLRARKESNKDLKAWVEKHNTRLGIRVVRQDMRRPCKCHGVSGACTVKTCWRQLAPFHKVADALKLKYEDALEVNVSTNQATGRAQLRTQAIPRAGNAQLRTQATPQAGDVVFINRSPDFCRRSPYSDGTAGRPCVKGHSCDSVCCGQGYNTRVVAAVRPCHCQVIWCCEVKCKKCSYQKELFTCK